MTPVGLKYVREAAREHTLEAIETLVNVMLDPKENGSARVSAANSLLDRGFGKPSQSLELGLTRRSLDEMTDDELKAIASGEVVEGVAVEGELQ